ncbi:MAG: NAAT family transporter [Pseudomonadota bacterium]|nr:MAG: NAAT family transporter [Pseudomonadota bacterium]
MIPEAALVSYMAALFSMMNPIGNVGVFASLTENLSATQARRIAWTCALSVSGALLIVAWSGSLLLEVFGITVDSLRAGGGLIVLLIGLHMLFNQSAHKQSPAELEDAGSRTSIAVVPLTIPLVAGPGAMVTVLIAAEQHSSVLNRVEISLVILGFAALIGLLFTFATPVSRRIGESGMGAITRVMGMILAAIAMGMLTEGLKALLPGLDR